jgi:hypothetical protein
MTDAKPPHVLVLTPMKNAVPYLDGYFEALCKLDYPADRLSLGVVVSDSDDGTHDILQLRSETHGARFRRISLLRKDFGLKLPSHLPRWTPAFQYPRRVVLAKSRNYLLFSALDDEDWVLWLDCDVVAYPPDILWRLLGTRRDIVQPHCVKSWGGETFDLNAWRDKGRVHMQHMRGGPPLQPLDAVGGTMLLVRADVHREGLIFPPFPFGQEHPAIRDSHPILPPGQRGELETEGLGVMAKAMGYQCWAMPEVEILHAPL